MERFLPTPFGPLILIAGAKGLVYCNWYHPDCLKKYQAIKKTLSLLAISQEEYGRKILDSACLQVEEYFAGERKYFDIPVEFIGTPFQKRVWKQLCCIPYSSTISYKELSGRCNGGGGYRAVAQACSANPLAVLVPCHRVIGSNGELGGYTGGIDKKAALLKLETRFNKKE